VHGHHVAVGRQRNLFQPRHRHRHQFGVALVGAAGQFVVDQDAPHHGAGHGQEVAAVLPVGARLLGHAEPGLVRQPGGAERVAGVFLAQVAACHAPQLVVEHGKELRRRLRAGVAKLAQPKRDLVRVFVLQHGVGLAQARGRVRHAHSAQDRAPACEAIHVVSLGALQSGVDRQPLFANRCRAHTSCRHALR
jgi:hypothetical protein